MLDKLKKTWGIMVQLDSSKEARLVAGMEHYGDVIVNQYTEKLYTENKVQLTIPTPRRYWAAVRRSMRYSNMGILSCVVMLSRDSYEANRCDP